MTDPLMTVYSTKYALTAGIKKFKVRDRGNGMVEVTDDGYSCFYLHGEGREWHRTWEAAAMKARMMQKQKIENLRRQLKKLENLRFEEIP